MKVVKEMQKAVDIADAEALVSALAKHVKDTKGGYETELDMATAFGMKKDACNHMLARSAKGKETGGTVATLLTLLEMGNLTIKIEKKDD